MYSKMYSPVFEIRLQKLKLKIVTRKIHKNKSSVILFNAQITFILNGIYWQEKGYL